MKLNQLFAPATRMREISNLQLVSPELGDPISLHGSHWSNAKMAAGGGLFNLWADQEDGSIRAVATRRGEGWTWEIISNSTTAQPGGAYLINASGGSIVLTLPPSPSEGDEVLVCDYYSAVGTYSITVGRNGSPIEGETLDYSFPPGGLTRSFVYSDSNLGWLVHEFNIFR